MDTPRIPLGAGGWPKPGNGSGNGSNVRYIPLEEFHLWRYYMEQEHGFRVEDAEISYWAGTTRPLMEWAEQIAPERLEAVVEIRFFARSSEAGTAIPGAAVSSGELRELRALLLKHYPALHSSAKELVPEPKENRGFLPADRAGPLVRREPFRPAGLSASCLPSRRRAPRLLRGPPSHPSDNLDAIPIVGEGGVVGQECHRLRHALCDQQAVEGVFVDRRQRATPMACIAAIGSSRKARFTQCGHERVQVYSEIIAPKTALDGDLPKTRRAEIDIVGGIENLRLHGGRQLPAGGHRPQEQMGVEQDAHHSPPRNSAIRSSGKGGVEVIRDAGLAVEQAELARDLGGGQRRDAGNRFAGFGNDDLFALRGLSST